MPFFGDHAASSYAWSRPPSRSWRWTWRGDARAAGSGVGLASGARRPGTAVRAVRVVLADVLAPHPFALAPVPEDDPIQARAPERADPAFADRVGPGRPERWADPAPAFGAEHPIARPGEAPVPIAERDRPLGPDLAPAERQGAGRLG